jgi:DNA-binding MarR family transcriptional regulator
MTQSYNHSVHDPANPRLANLLASLSLNLAEEARVALDRATGLSGSGSAALLALDEFLGGANVGRLADVLGLTHSGAVRLVAQLEAAGLAARSAGADRRNVELRLTPAGRRRVRAARAARAEVLARATEDLDPTEAEALEGLLERLVAARVRDRVRRRAEGGGGGAWWCRTCDFAACGRPDGRCPAQVTAAAMSP